MDRSKVVTHLIFGCGYLGQRVAQRWLAAGHTVGAVTRQKERAEQFQAAGIQAILGDVTQPESLANLPAAEIVLFAVGHDRRAGKPIEDVYVTGLANALAALGPQVRQFIYISSTGVYGQTDGSSVSEDSPALPQRAGGKACLAAEDILASSRFADRRVVLRCAGLYGPGRIPRIDDVRQQVPIAAAPDACLNLIHIDDAAAIVCAVAERIPPSRLYLVSDGQPVLRRDFYDAIASQLQLPAPTFAPPTDVEHRRAGGDNKRINNERMRREISLKLQYADYRDGLAATLAAERR